MNFNAVLNIYGTILLEFLLELFLIAAISLLHLNRRNYFWLRAALSLLGLAAVTFGLSFFYYYFGGTIWGRVISYAILFFFAVLAVKICFKEENITILFALSMAYALQNLMYNAWLFFYVIFQASGFADSWGGLYDLFYHLFYYGYLALFVFALFFFFGKRSAVLFKDRRYSKKMLSITAFALLSAVVLCSLMDVSFASLSDVRENHFSSPTLYLIREAGVLMGILSALLVLFLGSQSVAENRLSHEVEYLQFAISQAKKQYEVSKETVDLINRKCHDIKYQLNALAVSGNITPDAVRELSKSVRIYDSQFDTGNKLLDVLLVEKAAFCNDNGIAFSPMLDGTNLAFMESGDLYCLFGNLIDNAIEAVMKIEDKEKRIIRLSVRRRGNIVFIEEDNYFVGKLSFDDGLPMTTKGDSSYHGFGTRSIRAIVRSYGGEFTVKTDGEVFSASILLIDKNAN